MEVVPQDFMACGRRNHENRGSKFPRDRVPSILFLNPHNGSFYKLCYDCRQYSNKHRPKTNNEPDEQGEIKCGQCRTMRTKEFCEKCAENNRALAKKKIEIHNLVIWERISEIGSCCEKCKRVFLKKRDGTHGFITVNSMNGVSRDDIEYRNMEFDHLTEEEQTTKFGKYHGPKKMGVAKIYSYASKKAEAKKCALLCLFCHKLKTKENWKKPVHVGQREIEKIEYVKKRKIEVGACEMCGYIVDETNFSYYECDHIDPSTKRTEISRIAKGTSGLFTLNYLIEEMSGCRILCAFCHRIHSGKEHGKKFELIRETKRNKSTTK